MQTELLGVRLSGDEISIRASELGSLQVAQGGSRFEEAVNRGNVWIVANQATVVTQAGLSATSPALVIAPRIGQGKVVKLWYAGCGSLVAYAAGAAEWLCLGGYSATAVVETTAAVVRNMKTGDIGPPPGVACLIASTLPAAPVVIAELGMGVTGTVAVDMHMSEASRWFDGAIWINPGYNLSIQTSTAGTLFCEFIFEVQDE